MIKVKKMSEYQGQVLGQTFQLTFEQAPDFNYSPESIDKLSEYEKYELSYHPERPKYLDYLEILSAVES